MSKKIKAIIFDMDGVLVDSEKQQINLEIATLKEYGISATQELCKEYLGSTAQDFFRDIGERFEMNWSEKDLEEVILRHAKTKGEYYAEVFPLVPHAFEVLEKSSKKYRIGLSTSSSRKNAEAVLSRHRVLDFFEARTFGDQVENGKPDPEIFLKTLEKLNDLGEIEDLEIEDNLKNESNLGSSKVNLIKTSSKILPEQCVVVEDSSRGMQGAKAAGMKVIGRRAGHNSHYDFKNADFVIEDLYDLEEVLNNLEK